MRNRHPLLPDTLKQMYADGVRQAVVFIAAAHHSYSGCQQYCENAASAQEALRAWDEIRAADSAPDGLTEAAACAVPRTS